MPGDCDGDGGIRHATTAGDAGKDILGGRLRMEKVNGTDIGQAGRQPSEYTGRRARQTLRDAFRLQLATRREGQKKRSVKRTLQRNEAWRFQRIIPLVPTCPTIPQLLLFFDTARSKRDISLPKSYVLFAPHRYPSCAPHVLSRLSRSTDGLCTAANSSKRSLEGM